MITIKLNEQALEAVIEKRLTGTCLEELKEQGILLSAVAERVDLYRGGNGFYIGSPVDFNSKYAIDEARFWNFLESTQKEELAKLQKQNQLEAQNTGSSRPDDQEIWSHPSAA